ncbi:MAG: methionine--tRNA ligase [Candidatus Ancillula sp.]|jgi:methionyl-tRNA synthetase|nr:methionine--tRNA ligase [Candidatus Ancillula sp.]
MVKRVLVCVAWPYANGPRHIGHVAGFGVPSDVYARYMRAKGDDVLMVSGTDEHGTPILVQAEEEGIEPQALADRYNAVIVQDLLNLGLSYDLFTRTTTVNHYKTVQELFLGLYNNGYMIKKTQMSAVDALTGRTLPDRYIEGTCPLCGYSGARGDQCDSCGQQLDPIDLQNPVSKIDGKPPKFIPSEHLFLDLPSLADELKKWLKTRTNWRPNVLKFSLGLLDDLQMRAMTRDIDWGVPVPLDGWKDLPTKRLYVWFDAVVGYLSASIEWARRKYEEDESNADKIQNQIKKAWQAFWTDDTVISNYFMGKDNITFHSQIWPAELLGYSGRGPKVQDTHEFGQLSLPTEVVSSEFLSMEGEKFSSSRGVVIYVKDFLDRYQVDALRYYIIVAGPETNDSDFTWSDFLARTNNELVAAWGNFVNRVANMIAKNFGKIPDISITEAVDLELLKTIQDGFRTVGNLIEQHHQKQAMSQLMHLVANANAYISTTQPFKLKGDVLGDEEKTSRRLAQILFTLAQVAVDLNTMFAVFLPHSSNAVYQIFGGSKGVDGGQGPDVAAVLPSKQVVKDLDDSSRSYPIITGDYSVGLSWKHHEIVKGTVIKKPEPIFKKLDPSIVDEELNRMTGI